MTLPVWMNAPWVVGIGGGILSGILVTFVSRKILARKDRGEYLQKAKSANRELIYALRIGIPEGHIPSRKIVESLINATARKYSIDKNDLYNPSQITEELIKEILDSSFISANTKQEYCNRLDSISEIPLAEKEVQHRAESQVGPRLVLASYRKRMITMASTLLGMTTALLTMLLAVSEDSGFVATESITLLLPAIVAISMTIVAATLMLLRNESRRLLRRKVKDNFKVVRLSTSKDDND